jgi:hypothetical protein
MLRGVDSERFRDDLRDWDYSQGESGPDPMSVPRLPKPWGTDTLPSQEDPRWFSIPPGEPYALPPPTEWQTEAQNRQQARRRALLARQILRDKEVRGHT